MENLEDLTKAELFELAEELGSPAAASLSKSELVDHVRKLQAGEGAPEDEQPDEAEASGEVPGEVSLDELMKPPKLRRMKGPESTKSITVPHGEIGQVVVYRPDPETHEVDVHPAHVVKLQEQGFELVVG